MFKTILETLKTRTAIACIVAIVATVLKYFDFEIDNAMQAEIVDNALSVIAGVSTLMAIVFRGKATKVISASKAEWVESVPALLFKILSAFAPFIPKILEWWQLRQEQARHKADQALDERIDNDSGPEFVRKFDRGRAERESKTASPNPDQPGSDR